MTYVDVYNLLEAGFWFVVAAMVVVRGRSTRGMTPLLAGILVVALIAFGISDLVELKTGAWWNPPALLVLKGACLTALVLATLVLVRNRRPRAA